MIKTPLSTVIGGAFWTPSCTVISGQQNIHQLIKSLFSDGTQGLYLNAQDAVSVSDLSNIKDLSGRNNHAVQADSAKRATLITDPSSYKSLKFDGIDDCYVTQSIDFSSSDEMTVIAAIKQSSVSSTGIVAELSARGATNNGGFYFAAPSNHFSSLRGVAFRGTASASAQTIYTGLSDTFVATGKAKISTPLVSYSENGIKLVNDSSSLGTGNFGNYPLFIGRRNANSLSFNGQIYALLVIGKLLDDATTQKIEKEFAKYIGVTL